MTASIALLRAVNVGGRTVPMAALRSTFTELGARDVRTYIQSGNVVYEPPKKSARAFAEQVERAILDRFGVNSAVIIRTRDEIRASTKAIPFPANSRAFVHIGFFKAKPTADEVHTLMSLDAGDERCTVVGRECYLYLPNGVGRAKLAARLNRLETPVTVRNLRTVATLEQLASETFSQT